MTSKRMLVPTFAIIKRLHTFRSAGPVCRLETRYFPRGAASHTTHNEHHTIRKAVARIESHRLHSN